MRGVVALHPRGVVAWLAALAVFLVAVAAAGQPRPPPAIVAERAGMVRPEHEPYGADHSLGGTLRGYYGRFTRVNPHKQLGWITTYSLTLLLLLVLLGGFPQRELAKAALLTVPASALVVLTPLGPWFRLHPLLGVAGVCFAMTLALRAVGGPAKHREFRQLAGAGLVMVTLAWLPTSASRVFVRLAFDGAVPGGPARVAGAWALLATGLFVVFVALAALRFERLDRAGLRRFGRPLAALWLATLALGVPLVVLAERVGDWRLRTDADGRWLEGFRVGPEIVMALSSIAQLVAAVALFRGPPDRRRLLRYAGAVGALYAALVVAWRAGR